MTHSGGKSTKRRRGLAGFFALLVFGVATACALTLQNDGNWQTIAVDDAFSFRLPPGFVKSPATTDQRGEYDKGETKVVFVWGQSESGPFEKRQQAWMNDYEETTTRIGGRRASIRTYSQAKHGYVGELNVGNWDRGEVQLFMRIEGKDSATLKLADQIFKSVTLPVPSPERP